MTNIRALNKAGIEALRSFLVELKTDPKLAAPGILEDPQYTELVADGAAVELREFSSKLDFGQYITKVVKDRVLERTLRTSVGLWAWLALFYLDQVCPRDGNGRRKVLRLEKYIPSAGHIATGLDKHLLFFPWKMVALHGDSAGWILGGQIHEDSKVVRELANSYRRNVSAPFVQLARSLYFDEIKSRVRIGATTNRAGSLRRLDRVFNQLDLTYDVFGINANELVHLLPKREFARWLPQAPPSAQAIPQNPSAN
jgi:hypothetical protein